MSHFDDSFLFLAERGVVRSWHQVDDDYIVATESGVQTLDEREALAFIGGALAGLDGEIPVSTEMANMADEMLDDLVQAAVLIQWIRDEDGRVTLHPKQGSSFELSGWELVTFLHGSTFGYSAARALPEGGVDRIRERLVGLRRDGLVSSWELDVEENSLTIWTVDDDETWVPLDRASAFMSGVDMMRSIQ